MVNKAVKKRFHTIDALCAIASECFVISLKIITGKFICTFSNQFFLLCVGEQSPSYNSSDLIPSATKSKILSPNSYAFIDDLGPEKLTALGRVDAARVMVDSLGITRQNVKPGY